MQLKFLVPLALALVSSVSAATVPSTDFAQAKEACSKGEVLHTTTTTYEGKEIKMTVTSCPGLAGRAADAESTNQLEKRDVVLSYLGNCDFQCYYLGTPAVFSDCEYLSNALELMPGTFGVSPHTLITWSDGNERCDYSFYNLDDYYTYDVYHSALGSIGYSTAETCIGSNYGAGNCFNSGIPGYSWAVEFFNPSS